MTGELEKLGKVTITVEIEGRACKLPKLDGLEKVASDIFGKIVSDMAMPKDGYIDPKCKETEEKRSNAFETSTAPSE